ncbi:hypothetical protein PUN28_014962 [Cardiocondyla obscurior]|uniref:Uncharacterized protein n=1 Tax=Cardiocondyla obscurior TaxID=286306 RepID=A0AAW2EZF7_9HYME
MVRRTLPRGDERRQERGREGVCQAAPRSSPTPQRDSGGTIYYFNVLISSVRFTLPRGGEYIYDDVNTDVPSESSNFCQKEIAIDEFQAKYEV